MSRSIAKYLYSLPNFLIKQLLVLVGGLVAVGVYLIFRTQAAGVYIVPPSITADCSRSVQTELIDFIETVPNGSIIQFSANACYGQSAQLEINDRSNLTIDGNGSTFRILAVTKGCQANWRIQGGSNVTIKNMIARGTNTTGFDGPRINTNDAQCAHGFSFDSTQGGKLLNSQAYDIIGDPVSIEPDIRKGDYCIVPPARDILIDGFRGVNAGRTVGITNADGVIIQNSYFGDMYDGAVDLEADTGCEWVRNIKLLNNHFGRYHYAMINLWTNPVQADHIGNIEIRGNVSDVEPSSCYAPINIAAETPTNLIQVENVIISNNDLRTLGQGINATYISNSKIENNTLRNAYGRGCNGPSYPNSYGIWLDNAHNVNIYDNKLINGNTDPNVGFTGGMFRTSSTTSAITQNPPQSPNSIPPPPPTPSTNLQGDVNHDGHVDGADLSIVLRFFGTTETSGDANGDAQVNGQDISIVLRLYGI